MGLHRTTKPLCPKKTVQTNFLASKIGGEMEATIQKQARYISQRLTDTFSVTETSFSMTTVVWLPHPAALPAPPVAPKSPVT